MAAGRHEYVATFAIAGRLLGSFGGAMKGAQSQMKAVQRTALAFGKTMKTVALGLLGLGGVLSGLMIGKLFGDLFRSATAEAIEAHKRVRNLTSAFLRLSKVQATVDPRKTAETEVRLLQERTALLAKESLYHSEIYDSLAAGLARYGMYPKEIADILPSLGELLAELKDISATEEDAMELGIQFGQAIKTGNMRAVRATGILNKEQLAQYKKLTSVSQRYYFVLEALAKYRGTMARAAATPEGRIQLLRKQLREMRHEVGEQLLPVWAALADQTRDFLNVILKSPEALHAWGDLKNAFGQLLRMFGLNKKAGESWGKFIGEALVSELSKLAREIENICIWLNAFRLEMADTLRDWNNFKIGIKAYGQSEAGVWKSIGKGIKKGWDWMFGAPATKPQAAIGREWSETFKNLEAAYKLPNGLLGAIAKQENVNPAYNNPLGLSGARGVYHYPSYAAGAAAAEKQVRLMTNPSGPYRDFVKSGYKDIEALARVWSPVGAANDIHGTNATEAAGIRSFMPRTTPDTGIPPLLRRPMTGPQASVNFAPVITINGNATEAEQRAMDTRLRDLARDFINQFSAAQYQERRLSYQGGYG